MPPLNIGLPSLYAEDSPPIAPPPEPMPKPEPIPEPTIPDQPYVDPRVSMMGLGGGGIAPAPQPEPDLAPDFVRQIPTWALEEDRNNTRAEEWAAPQRQWIADRWREVQDNRLWVTAQETKDQWQQTLSSAAESALTSPGAEYYSNAMMRALPQEVASGERTINPLEIAQLAGGFMEPGAGVNDPENLARAAEQYGGDPEDYRMSVGVWPGGGPSAGKWAAAMQGDDALAAFNAAPQAAPGIRQRLGELMGNAEKALLDRFAPINKVGPETEALMSTYAGRTEGAFQRAADDLGPVYQAIGDDLPQLNKYVGLQSYIENAAAKLNPDRLNPVPSIKNVGDAKAALTQMEADLGPQLWSKIQNADAIRTQAMSDLLQNKVQAGLIKPELAQFLEEQIPHYNPTVITHYLEEAAAGRGGSTLRQMSNTLKRLTEEGSESEILPPMQAAVKHMMDSDLAIRRNTLLNTLVEEGGFKAKPAIKLETGVNIAPEAEGELATIAQRGVRNPQGKALFMRDGTLMEAELPQDIAQAIDKMSTEQLGAVERIASNLNRGLRVGATTLNPAFMIANAARDYVSAFMREGITPPQLLSAYKEALQKGDLYKQFVRAGGGYGEGGSIYSAPTRSMGLAEAEKKIAADGGTLIKNPADMGKLLNLFNDQKAVELGPRLATFAKHIAAGATPEQAAMAGRRVTVDFSRAGSLTRELNAFTPFLNARFQGGANLVRTIRDNRTNPAFAARLAALTTAAGGLYLWNKQFPEYKDVPQYLKDAGFQTVMLPGSEPNENGLGYKAVHFLALPLGEWGAFTTGVEQAMKAMDGDSPGLMDALGSVVNAANPLPGGEGFTSTLASVAPVTAPGKALFEAASNYDFFRDRPIESESMRNLLPELRYTPRTPELAKKMANVLADKPIPDEFKSPQMIDHLISGTFGGGGRMAEQGISTLMGQESDRAPVVGGLFQTINRTYGGEIENQAYKERDAEVSKLQNQYRPMIRAIEENVGSGTVTQLPSVVQGVPLQPAEQAVYQKAKMEALKQIFAENDIDRVIADEPPAVRKAVLQELVTGASEVAAALVLQTIGDDQIEQRVVQRQGRNESRALPTVEYSPVGAR